MRPRESVTAFRGNHGFTLLELIISITMVALMVVVIVGAMRLGYRSIEKGERKMDDLQRIRASLSVIESQVESELPISYDDPDKGRILFFSGSREAVRFPTTYSLWTNERGYVLASYQVVTDEQRKKAIQVTENTMNIETYREAILLKGYDSIYFEYFYREPAEEKGIWVEVWQDTAVLPEKIRLHFVSGTQHFVMTIPMRTPPSASAGAAAMSAPGAAETVDSGKIMPRASSPKSQTPSQSAMPRRTPAPERVK